MTDKLNQIYEILRHADIAARSPDPSWSTVHRYVLEALRLIVITPEPTLTNTPRPGDAPGSQDRNPPTNPVHHPAHYTEHPSGVECITITEHMNFCLGNAMKYIWRADKKNGIEDLEKARWYLDRELARRHAGSRKV
jgi:hypothetical protein